MKNSDVATALGALRPLAQWTINGSDLSTLIWLDQIQTQPTNQEILDYIAAH